MATQLLAPGITDAVSSNVVLAANDVAIVFLTTPAPGGYNSAQAGVQIQFLSAAGVFSTVKDMIGPDRSEMQIPGPVTFRIYRPAIPQAWGIQVGVDRG